MVHRLLLAAAISAVCSTCLNVLLKIVFRTDCIDSNATSGNSQLRPAAAACLAASALSFILHAALIKHVASSNTRPLANRGRALFVVLFSNWTLPYFVFVSLQQLAITSIVIYGNSSGQFDGACFALNVSLADAASCAMPLFLCRDCVPCLAICERTQRQCFGGAPIFSLRCVPHSMSSGP